MYKPIDISFPPSHIDASAKNVHESLINTLHRRNADELQQQKSCFFWFRGQGCSSLCFLTDLEKALERHWLHWFYLQLFVCIVCSFSAVEFCSYVIISLTFCKISVFFSLQFAAFCHLCLATSDFSGETPASFATSFANLYLTLGWFIAISQLVFDCSCVYFSYCYCFI